MSRLPSAVHRLFARQHGAASTNQLVAAGLSERQIEVLSRNGTIVRVARGAFRSPSVPDSELMRCAALSLAHPHIAIAGPTAGRLWGFRHLPSDQRIHLLAPRSSHPSTVTPWVVTYHSNAVRAIDIVQRDDAIRLTSRARTTMDLARSRENDDLRSIAEQAMFDGHLTPIEMLEVGADFVRGRRWVRRYMDAVGSRVRGGPAESHAEVVVGEGLASRGVTGLVRQHRLRCEDRLIRFDLAVPDLRWAIEVDVFPTHAETVGARSDRRRDEFAASTGWSVSRISRAEYEQRLASRLDELTDLHHSLRRSVG